MELRMLDPYVRKTLTNTGNGTFTAQIKVPDVYGVFKFQMDYKRPGLSWVKRETVVPIRPFRHDEYARFLSQAFPYYASVLSMSLGFLVVGKAFVFDE
jgi:oligosaccharyltransferase complex subunit beta